MRLEALTVCVGYDDFLAQTVLWNKALFDRWVIVTTPTDLRTLKLCEFHHLECLATDSFGVHRGEFRKGAGINAGLTRLTRTEWVLHLDADIALPPQTRGLLERSALDPTMLYGVDRHNVVGRRAWAKHVRRPPLQQEADVYVHTEAYPVAPRFMSPQYGGYLPIGFFQLWAPAGSGVTSYPEHHANAGRTDMLFAGQWPRCKRALIPELIAYHLESERSRQGANWAGRTTRRLDQRWTPYGAVSRWRRRRSSRALAAGRGYDLVVT